MFGISQAQEFDLGINAGVNFSQFQDAKNFDSDSRTGLLAGAFVGVKFSDRFAIQPEILYSQQGGRFRFWRLSYRLCECTGNF